LGILKIGESHMQVRKLPWAAIALAIAPDLAITRTRPTEDAQRDRVAALIRQLGHKEFAKREAAFSPDGAHVVTAGDGAGLGWDAGAEWRRQCHLPP
jgi:hypothetical protein